jgi:hypothetical protein
MYGRRIVGRDNPRINYSRLAMESCQLKVRHDRVLEARTILAPICEALADEAEFSDLQIARKLLNSWPAGPT